MSKTVVIYKSNYGGTETYAQSIAKTLSADLFCESEVDVEKLFEYDTIVFGGGLYASGINGVSLITKNFEKLKDKNLIVFTVGLAETSDKRTFVPIIKKCFTDKMIEKIVVFNLRGGIDYKRLNLIHRAMMAMLKTMISRKKELSNEEKQMIETYGGKVDFTDIKTIEPLVEYVKNLTK